MAKKTFVVIFVTALLCACEEIIEVTDISNEQVTLLAPSNDVIVTNDVVNFNWSEVDEAEGYEVQIVTPSFDNASQFVLDTVLVVDSTFVGSRLSKTLQNNSYQWRVRAQNSDFATPYSTNTFTVQAQN